MKKPAQETRQHILDVAKALMTHKGYTAVGLAEVVAAAGVPKGSFYYYFKSKEEVFQALRDETALRVRPRLRAERIRARNFEEFISGSFRAFFDFVKADQVTFATMRDNQDLQHVRIDTPEVLAGFDELRVDLEIAIRNGVMPETDPDLLMAAMVGVAFEVAGQLVKREDLTVADAAQFATALFLGGVQALPRRIPRTER
jgi:AcrR family transcriptional regulator